jgi:guanylate kinase
VGKGTVVRRLLALRPDLAYSVSCTTREPRLGEVEGRDYRFVTPGQFAQLVEEGAFLEWAEVFGHRYGTLWGPIASLVEEGRDVILELDVQGARRVRDRDPDAVLVFLAPPSTEELARRLRARGTEDGAELERRLAGARWEMDQQGWFDHVVVNDEVDLAGADVASIIDGTPKDGVSLPDEDPSP